jgi:L-amino acid N-acyltransferase YncA
MSPAHQNSPASAPTYLVSVAKAEDIPDILALQAENQISNGGALSVEFPAPWFERAVKDMPIVIARREGRLVGFLVSSSQAATQHLALPQAKYRAYPARPGAYNSGPLCIAASERGRGLVSELFRLQRSLLRGREGVAFIRRDNAVSQAVHTKYGFREVATFSHADVEYIVVSYAGGEVCDAPAQELSAKM